jgi:4-alpha-glucanotransferase
MSRSSRASRRAGILVPLFSLSSSRGWGIGEIPDIPPFARWLESGGQRLLQLLPINEMPPGETSPYSALSAMAIDPQFVGLSALEDFAAIGGEASLDSHERQQLESVRQSPTVDYATVRPLKQRVLRRAFAHFNTRELATGTRRGSAFRAFCEQQAWWLDDYALFRALHAHHDERCWFEWPEPLRRRDAAALEDARRALVDDVRFRQYAQWVAADQWGVVRDTVGDVELFGDLPFMVSGDSADVWARQDEFRLDASVGVPPDAFSATGQDWGLPVYRWDVLAARDFDWLRNRARRNADLFDGYRVDHLVGFYRTYLRPHDGSEPSFVPDREPEQRALGERVLAVFREPGTQIIAEDLGVSPDFVRESLTRLGVPGYRVFRWERHWHDEGHPFRDPLEYPASSIATSGTHDTEPMCVWWEGAPHEERRAVLQIASVAARLGDDGCAAALQQQTMTRDLHEALIDVLLASGSDVVILPIQDIFGWRDRINQPATVSRDNWTWRLPWPSDRMVSEPDAIAVATQLREWTRARGRVGS